MNEFYMQLIIITLGYLFLLATSGKLVGFILSKVATEKTIAQKEQLDTGFIIGIV